MITISIDRAPAEIQRLIKQIPRHGIKAMRRAARRAKALVVQRTDTAKPYPAVDQGFYREAWTVNDIPTGAILFNPQPHAPIVEYGALPHTPPFSAIMEWVVRKFKRRVAADVKAQAGGRPIRGERFGFARGQRARVDRRLVGIAWAVWQKIRKHGVEPRRVLSGGFQQMQGFVEQELLTLKRDIESGRI